ncbi:MAG TPA: hypothetical protein VMZ91_00135 [Candidatus Paceibacterota bacterium]|nr:hypothetical protein [Candidatus Paceibacterota bacterium]
MDKLNESFTSYIELLKSFETANKEELNDLLQQEEIIREDIQNRLNKLKEERF